MRKTIPFLLFLSGCGLVNSAAINKATSQAELVKYTDDQLCNPNVSATATVQSERRARNLGDCSTSHRRCAQLGYRVGDPQYLSCRQAVASEIAAERQAQISSSAILLQQGATMMQAPPPPKPTVCNFIGQTMICQ